MPEHSLRQLNLETVIEGCQAESARSRTQERGYGFELFRRALEEKEPGAWAAIDNQYKNLILHWLYGSTPTLSRQEAKEIGPQAWQKRRLNTGVYATRSTDGGQTWSDGVRLLNIGS